MPLPGLFSAAHPSFLWPSLGTDSFYDIPVSVVGIISDPFLTEHMMVKPEIIKLFHGIRKRDETAVCDFHEGLIPFLAGQLLVGRGGPLLPVFSPDSKTSKDGNSIFVWLLCI